MWKEGPKYLWTASMTQNCHRVFLMKQETFTVEEVQEISDIGKFSLNGYKILPRWNGSLRF